MEEANLLGKKIEYPQKYCPEILIAIPRSINREIYRIENIERLFCGYDAWHAYEASFILNNGMPVVGVIKIVYPANSQYIVESKSLKLYFGSFHMTPLGGTKEEGIIRFISIIETDLSLLLKTTVKAHFYQDMPQKQPFDFKDYSILEDHVNPHNLNFSVYQEHPAFLSENVQGAGELKAGSHLLKSNCKITNQPDWGTTYIYLKGSARPSEEGLLKYIVSLRNENHFHEEICEMTYKRLWDLFKPEILAVSCLYTRRGGIDICPTRANRPEFLPESLPKHNILTAKEFRQ